MSEQITSECGCNACYSGSPEYCENGPYWHERCDRLTQAIAEAERALEEIATQHKGPASYQLIARAALTRIRAAKGGE